MYDMAEVFRKLIEPKVYNIPALQFFSTSDKNGKLFMNLIELQVHAVAEEDYVALPYNSMERPVINGEDSVPLKFTVS